MSAKHPDEQFVLRSCLKSGFFTKTKKLKLEIGRMCTEVPVKVLLLCFSWVKIHDGRLLYSRRRCALTLQEFAVRTPSEEEDDARPRKHSRVGKIG